MKVLDIGQCDYDHSNISKLIEKAGAQTVRAHTKEDVLSLLKEDNFRLILVNRIIDSDHSSGLELIADLKTDSQIREIPIMLVSNLPDAQDQAEQLGALRGFGKKELNNPTTLERVKKALA